MNASDFTAALSSPPKPASQNANSSYKSVPTGRLKKVAGLVQRVNQLTSALKEGAEMARENAVAQVNVAPPCLSKVMGQLRAQDKSFASDAVGKRRSLNKRFMNSLFIRNIDAEEVEASMVHLDYDLSALTTVDGKCYVPADAQYQTKLRSRYDARKNQLVFSTSMTMMESESAPSSAPPSAPANGSSLSDKSAFDGLRNKKFSLVKDASPAPLAQNIPSTYELSKKLDIENAKATIRRLVEESTAREAEKAVAEDAELYRQLQHPHHHHHHHHHHNKHQHPTAPPPPPIPMITTLSGEKIPITREESEHYFGDVARIHFFDRMRKIMAKLNQLAPFGPNQQYLQQSQQPSSSSQDDLGNGENGDMNTAFLHDDNSTIVTSATLSASLNRHSPGRISSSSGGMSGSTSLVSHVYNPSLPASIASQIEQLHQHPGFQEASSVTDDDGLGSITDPYDAQLSSSMSLASTFRAYQHNQQHQQHPPQTPFPPMLASSGSVASITSMTAGGGASSTASLVSSSLPLLSTEFFAELGSLASNDHIKRRVDRDLMAHAKPRNKPILASLTASSNSSTTSTRKSKRKPTAATRNSKGRIQLAPLDNKPPADPSLLSPLQRKRWEEDQEIQRHLAQEQELQRIQQEQERKRRLLQIATTTAIAVQVVSSSSKNSTPMSHRQQAQQQAQQQQQSHGNTGGGRRTMTESLTENVPVSPRTRYITHCLQAGLTPLPHLIIRREFTTSLNLAHYALGDGMGRILAYCLSDLPYLEHIDLNDNMLTDDSLQFIIQAIIAIPTIRVLNLSRNKIDGYSSTALAEYVARPDCPIETLILQCADVDDGECADFVQNLVTNEKLVELDLSANLLGSASGGGVAHDDLADDELLPPPSTTNGKGNDEAAAPETGGEALALFIASSSCRLQTLRLGWNTMRGYPARMLMQYISYNHTLTFLDLSCNGLGPIAGEILGDALIANKTLRTLLVNNNQFTASATVSICIGITENFSLRHIELNENPIGMLGGKMIMANAVSWGSRVVVEAKNCNTTMAFDERAGWFDPTNPCQDFHLHLAKPLHRAIAIYLLHLVATHSTFIVQNATIEPTTRSNGSNKPERLELIQGIARDREEYFDEEQRKVIAGLRLIEQAASNMDLAKQLFYEADADHSGKLDKDELQDVLAQIGFPMDVDRLNDIFAVFDVDGAGNIDMSEFILLLKAQAREAHARIKEMTEYPITALKPTNLTATGVIPSQKYVPPRSGILHLTITDGFVQKEHFLTMSTIDQKFAYHMAKRIGDVTWMNEAVRNTKMRYDEGLALYKTLFKELQDTPQVLMQVIPQMMFPSESRQLIAKVTGNHPREIARVKLAFGVALRPLLGAFNGYYCLDLSKEIHRLCLSRLLEQSQTWNYHQKRRTYGIIGPSKIGDVSQHGNWSCFRNERFNGQAIIITPQRFQPMPHSGTVEFDFSCAPRRSGQELLMSDKRVCKVLTNLAMLPVEHTTDGLNKLATWRKKSQERTRDGALFMPIYALTPMKAVEAGKAMDAFYANLGERQAQLRLGKKKEVGSGGSMDFDAEGGGLRGIGSVDTAAGGGGGDATVASGTETATTPAGETASSQRKRRHRRHRRRRDSQDSGDSDSGSGSDSDSGSSTASSSSSSSSRSSSSSSGSSSSRSSRSSSRSSRSSRSSSASSRASNNDENKNDDNNDDEDDSGNAENEQRRRLEAQRQRLLKILAAKRSAISVHGKAAKFLEVIEDTFGQLWLYTRHVALIVACFQELFGMTTVLIGNSRDFGSYVVDLIVLLFGRIVDLHNFELLYSLLDPREVGALFCRLGLLMVFNPMKPEVTLELDMDRREDRLLAKIIVYLSVVEPGINLTFKQFQWKREMDYIPGWELTDMWCTEEGMPIHGKLVFTYYSGEGRNKSGCIPDVFLRQALCAMTVIDEDAAVRDEDAEMPLDDDEVSPGGKRRQRAGEKHYQQNKDIWINYLSIASERDGSDGRYV